MALIVAGLSQRTAPLEVRERLVYPSSEIGDAVADLVAASRASEAVLLSTCHRTEVYLVDRDDDAVPAVWSTLSRRLGADVEPHGYVRRDREVVAHLFRVASGLDSMIVGEAQVHGQVRDAWELSRPRSGAVLNRLFQTALLVAGRVRNETAVGRGSASVSSAAVQLAQQIFGSLKGRSAMVLGAGDMAELALQCLTTAGVRTAIVANRTFDRAKELAARHRATAMRYEECWSALAEVDVLICSTAATHPVVSVEHVRPALGARGDRPLCILDIAVPRDVDPAVGTLENVFLYNLDDLRSVVSANLERRREEVPSAEDLIAVEAERYWRWLTGLAAVPVVTEVRAKMDELRERELASALRRLNTLSTTERQVVEDFSRSLMNKFLHGPTVRLRSAAANGNGVGVVDAARYLFDLEAEAETPREGAPPLSDAGET